MLAADLCLCSVSAAGVEEGDASDENDEAEFFDAMEESPAFITVTTSGETQHKWVLASTITPAVWTVFSLCLLLLLLLLQALGEFSEYDEWRSAQWLDSPWERRHPIFTFVPWPKKPRKIPLYHDTLNTFPPLPHLPVFRLSGHQPHAATKNKTQPNPWQTKLLPQSVEHHEELHRQRPVQDSHACKDAPGSKFKVQSVIGGQ